MQCQCDQKKFPAGVYARCLRQIHGGIRPAASYHHDLTKTPRVNPCRKFFLIALSHCCTDHFYNIYFSKKTRSKKSLIISRSSQPRSPPCLLTYIFSYFFCFLVNSIFPQIKENITRDLRKLRSYDSKFM